MTNERKTLSQFVLNEENTPLDILRATLDFVERNTDQGSNVVAEIKKAIRRIDKR